MGRKDATTCSACGIRSFSEDGKPERHAMTFAALMPHISAGRVAQRGNIQLRIRAKLFEQRGAHHPDSPWGPVAVNADMALADDWELVEEPITGASIMFDGNRYTATINGVASELRPDGEAARQAATIARLERYLRDVSDDHAAQQATNRRLERELAEAIEKNRRLWGDFECLAQKYGPCRGFGGGR